MASRHDDGDTALPVPLVKLIACNNFIDCFYYKEPENIVTTASPPPWNPRRAPHVQLQENHIRGRM